MGSTFAPTHEVIGGVSKCSMNDVEDYDDLSFVGQPVKWFRNCMNEPASIYMLADGRSIWAPRTSVRRLAP